MAFALRCVERAAWNPLFLEQLMHGGRTTDPALPASVQSVVQARLVALDDGERHRLRVASVLGKRFPLEALNHLLAEAPHAVPRVEHGLLRCEAGEGLFSHALATTAIGPAAASACRSCANSRHASAPAWRCGRRPRGRGLPSWSGSNPPAQQRSTREQERP